MFRSLLICKHKRLFYSVFFWIIFSNLLPPLFSLEVTNLFSLPLVVILEILMYICNFKKCEVSRYLFFFLFLRDRHINPFTGSLCIGIQHLGFGGTIAKRHKLSPSLLCGCKGFSYLYHLVVHISRELESGAGVRDPIPALYCGMHVS